LPRASLNPIVYLSPTVACPGYCPPPPHDRSECAAEQGLMVALGFASMRAVLRIVISHLAITVAKLAARAMHALRNACLPSTVTGGLIADLTRSRCELLAENAFLRQQLIVASRSGKRPGFRSHERGLLVLLARLIPDWSHALLLIKPETVLRWHREEFRLFWRRKSRSVGPREPRLAPPSSRSA
jgi:hypothetical protein